MSRKQQRAGYLTFPEILLHLEDGEGQPGSLLLAAGPGAGLGVLLVGRSGLSLLVSLHINFLSVLLSAAAQLGVFRDFPRILGVTKL